MKFVEISAAILFLSNYALAALSVFFCLMLFRHARNCGWVVLGLAFLTPFYFAFLRVAHGLPFMNYKRMVMDPDGLAKMSYTLDFPGFYLAMAAGLWLLVRDARRRK